MPGNNESVHMTRRYPKLRKKVLLRDSKIVLKIARAWDIDCDQDKVLSIYLKEKDNLSHERYWELMRTVWIICGGLKNIETFKCLMKSLRPQKYYFSTHEEAQKLRNMKDEFAIYRATDKVNDGGLSWTTSLKYAEEYKKMFNKNEVIYTVVKKYDVFAYVERNKETEIIILS